jgi:AAA domain
MYSPGKASSRIGNRGAPLPAPYDFYNDDNVEVHFRRGGVSMLAGVPGSFKTALALNEVVRWSDKDIYTQYFSIDSDESTIHERLCGIVTGKTLKEIKSFLRHDKSYFDRDIYDRLGDRVMFEYQNQNWDSMVYHVASYEQKYGTYPDLIVIDNLIDLASDIYDFAGMQAIIKNADSLAKRIGAHVRILHHARLVKVDSGIDVAPGQPPADNEIQGKMTQFPTLVMTLGAAGMYVRMAVVKNRFGWQYPDARKSHPFQVHSNMQVEATER